MDRQRIVGMISVISDMKKELLEEQRDRRLWKKAAETWMDLDHAERHAVELLRAMDMMEMQEEEVWAE